MPIFDYGCVNGHVHEHMTKDINQTHQCPQCSEQAAYRPSMPHILNMRMGIDPRGCPTAADKWAKAHEKGAQH